MKRNHRIACRFAGLTLAMYAIGCASSQPAPKISNPLEVTSSVEMIWQQCQQELKHRGFELDRVDQRSGIINTYPQTSAHWFECWRSDIADSQSWLESNFQTVRRKVQLQVDSTRKDTFLVRCLVEVERLAPDPLSSQRAGIVSIRDVLGSSAGAAPGLTPRSKKGEDLYWESLGDDPALEQLILSSIARRIQNTDGDRKL